MPISFNCPQCGRSFNVGEQHAGRRAKCNACGTDLTIPQPPAAPRSADPPSPAPSARPPARPPQPATEQRIPPARDWESRSDEFDDLRGVAREKATRRLRLLLIALTLLAGFAAPIVSNLQSPGSASLHFSSVEVVLTDMPLKAKVAAVHPLVAAVAVALLAFFMHNRIRGAIILALFAVPVVISAMEKAVAMPVPLPGLDMPGAPRQQAHWQGWAFLAALLMLLVVASARRYRPRWGWLWPVGAIGALGVGAGLAWLGGGLGIKALGAEVNVIGQFVKELTAGDAPLEIKVWMGAALLMLLLLALGAALALIDLPGLSRRGAKVLAGSAHLSCWSALILFVGLVAYQPVALILHAAGAAGYTPDSLLPLLNVLKPMALITGTALMLPAGLVDLIIGPVPRPEY